MAILDGETIRVLQWIIGRCEGEIDLNGLDEVSQQELAALLHVDVDGWHAEVVGVREYYENFGVRVPKALIAELDGLKERLDGTTSCDDGLSFNEGSMR